MPLEIVYPIFFSYGGRGCLCTGDFKFGPHHFVSMFSCSFIGRKAIIIHETSAILFTVILILYNFGLFLQLSKISLNTVTMKDIRGFRIRGHPLYVYRKKQNNNIRLYDE